MNFPRSLSRSRAASCAGHNDAKDASVSQPATRFQQWVSRLLAATIFQVPVAFEDETGFHSERQGDATVRHAARWQPNRY